MALDSKDARSTRRGLLRDAAAGFVLAAGGAALGRSSRADAAPAAAITFGEVVSGRGAFGVKLVNSSPGLAISGLRAELTALEPGENAAALRGVVLSRVAKGSAVAGQHRGKGRGVVGESFEGPGVEGFSRAGIAGVLGITTKADGSGVRGQADGPDAAGVFGTNPTGPGVWGVTPGSEAAAVFGQSDGILGKGVYGVAHGQTGVGVRGESDGPAITYGVNGYSTSAMGIGVAGAAPSYGVQGSTSGTTKDSAGVRGEAPPASAAWAGYFDGKAGSKDGFQGALGASVVDHPQDPANKTLRHAFVGSPELKNVYDGVVTTNAAGKATVQLAGYVEALNRDFRYQLTVIGMPAHAYISREIRDGRFEITTDRPSAKVCWLLTGIRRDPYAKRHALTVEETKKGDDRGHYLHPEEHGQPASMAIPLHRPNGHTVEVRRPLPGPGGPADME